jgi:iron complex transport system substrate-binding protein
MEQLVALEAGLLLTYPFGGGGQLGERLPGMVVLPVAEYLEPHPLGRAEWLRFFGVLFGKEEQADEHFRSIQQRYHAVRALLPADAAHPSVFFGSAWQGIWHVPGGDSYMATLLRDAGGAYRFAHRRGRDNNALNMEEVVNEALEADHWGMVLEVEGPVRKEDLTAGDERLQQFRAVRSAGLFAANSREADLFGKALLEPDLLLRDLLHLFHPERLPKHEPMYFRPVGQ